MPEPVNRSISESSPTGRKESLGLRYVRFRPLPVVLTLITLSLMVVLAQHIIERFRATQFTAQSRLAEVYIGSLLLPQVKRLSAGEKLDLNHLAEVAERLDPGTRNGSRMAMQIWGTDQTLIYSSMPATDITQHESGDLLQALAGQEIAVLEDDPQADDGSPLPVPFMEIYLPIRQVDGGPVIAVGEIYVDATATLADIRSFERTVILSTGLATAAVLFMLAISAYQSEQLRERLDAERRLTIQNERLRTAAEQARLDASRANEDTLNLVGAELHDGPVQLLTLASLAPSASAGATPSTGTSQSSLIRQAVDQLRELSSGLILPEIENLGLSDIVALAAERFRALSGVALRVTVPKSEVQLDLPRRICIYRVIQEGLTNAGRHGQGGDVQLVVEVRADVIHISIGSPQGKPGLTEEKGPTHRLGLQAMRRRLATFGGTVVLRDVGNATVLQVALPVSSDEPTA